MTETEEELARGREAPNTIHVFFPITYLGNYIVAAQIAPRTPMTLAIGYISMAGF